MFHVNVFNVENCSKGSTPGLTSDSSPLFFSLFLPIFVSNVEKINVSQLFEIVAAGVVNWFSTQNQ